MKRFPAWRSNSFAALLTVGTLLLGGAASPARAVTTRQDLVAHGSGERYWLARVTPDDARGGAAGPLKTHVYVRAVGESRWTQVTQVESRVVAMAHRGTQLALLLAEGDWLLVSEQAVVTGRPVPGGGQIVDLASDRDTLLALVRFRLPSTRPAASPQTPLTPSLQSPGARSTASAAAGAAPAAPGPARVALFALGEGGWVERADVGPGVVGPWADVSMAVVGPSVYVASRGTDGRGDPVWRVARPGTDGGWTDAGAVAPPGAPAEIATFKLLGGGPVPVLWTLRKDGGYSLQWFGPQGAPTQVVPPPPRAEPAVSAAAIAIERVRVLYGTDGMIFERSFDPMGPAPGAGPEAAPATAPAVADPRIILPARPIGPGVTRWVQPLLTVALIFTVIASLRRRQEMQEAMAGAHKLPLAPPGRRLLAGLIDAAPLLAAVAILRLRHGQVVDNAAYWDDYVVRGAALGGLGLYFLHTTLSEVLFGRTIGKAVCGLRVAGLDGKRPGRGALVARNLLRVIDVMIAFFPLVLVLYSPLRQRAGDVAAGTLVVLNKPVKESEGEEAVVGVGEEKTTR